MKKDNDADDADWEKSNIRRRRHYLLPLPLFLITKIYICKLHFVVGWD